MSGARWWLVLALVACQKAPPADPGADARLEADGEYLSGQTAFVKGDFKAAHQHFQKVRELVPSDGRLPAAEGEAYLAEGDVAQAVKQFEGAVKLDPRRATNWSRLGYLYTITGTPEQAREALDKALSLNPHDATALEAKGDLALKAGRPDDARALWLEASRYSAPGSRAELVLKAAADLEKRKLLPEARAVLEAAVDAGVSSAELDSELGDVAVQTGAFEAAVVAYTQAAQLNPKDPTLWELVGEAQRRLGHVAQAREAYQASLKVSERGVVHVALARLCQAEKDAPCVSREVDRALATATGEEIRELVDLAELLVSVHREPDALRLLTSVSEEPEQKGNLDVQLLTARVARSLKNETLVKAACTRVLSSGQPGARCP